MNISLRGNIKEFEDGINAYDVAKSFGGGFFKTVLAAKINGENKDLRTPLKDGDDLELLTFEDDYGKWTYRHTASHILAQLKDFTLRQNSQLVPLHRTAFTMTLTLL